MSIKKRLNKLEANMPCPRCGGSGDASSQGIRVYWPGDEDASKEAVKGCSRCGRKPIVVGTGYPTKEEYC